MDVVSVSVGRLAKLLLVFASTVMRGFEFHVAHNHVLLSYDSGCRETFFFAPLQLLACFIIETSELI
jgi:hypothetical protein